MFGMAVFVYYYLFFILFLFYFILFLFYFILFYFISWLTEISYSDLA